MPVKTGLRPNGVSQCFRFPVTQPPVIRQAVGPFGLDSCDEARKVSSLDWLERGAKLWMLRVPFVGVATKSFTIDVCARVVSKSCAPRFVSGCVSR
jgi:hypothetical protein